MDKLTDHELQILREINGDLPASSWGAWVGACYESLSEGGYITREGITEKGKQYLATASLASASAGDGDAEMLAVVKPRDLSYPLGDYWRAPSDRNNPNMFSAGYTWADKPHRLLYDLIAHVLLLRARLRALASEKEGRGTWWLVERRGCQLWATGRGSFHGLTDDATRAESAESQLSALRAENERLRKALEGVLAAVANITKIDAATGKNLCELPLDSDEVLEAWDALNAALRRARSELEANQ